VLFVAVLGFNVGGLAGAFAALSGSLLPSASLALAASRWGEQRRAHRGVRAFTEGMAPVTIGLLLSTCWVLVEPVHARPAAWVLLALTVAFMQLTRRSPLWPIAAGAAAGGLGIV
jgi:chromate transporter